MTKDKRSPLKDKPLRYPGQSLDEQRLSLLDDKVLEPLLLALFLVVLALLEWWRYLYPQPPLPWLVSVMALGGIGYAVWSISRVRRRLKQMRLGSEGEKAVGQFLERLRQNGYQVFHDVIGSGFNLDHVLVGPQGIFAVETKTISKPARGEARIEFDGGQILVGGFEPDRNPIVQAKAQADWLRNLIAETSGRNVIVRPIVTYPGWWVEARPAGSRSDVWVLNPKAIPAFIEHEDTVLAAEDVALISFHISRYVRAREAD
jgi:hypothetical protein